MQLNSESGVPYTLLAPPMVQDKKAGKHNSKNQKGTQICKANSLELEDDLDYITLVFIIRNI